MQPAMSQVCCLAASLEDDLHGYADAGVDHVEVWLTKLENYLQSHSVDDLKTILERRGLSLVAASFQGGLLLSQGEARRETWIQFEQRLQLLSQLQIPTLIVATDFLGPFSQTDIERAQVSLAQAGQLAAGYNVRLAVEFQCRGTFINNLETAVSLVQSVEQPNVGICLDLVHFTMGPSRTEDLKYLTNQNLFHVQVCDVADRPRELAQDSDRIFPGEGDCPIDAVMRHLKAIDYQGAVSLEVMNPQFWSIPPKQVGEVGITSVRALLKDKPDLAAGMKVRSAHAQSVPTPPAATTPE